MKVGNLPTAGVNLLKADCSSLGTIMAGDIAFPAGLTDPARIATRMTSSQDPAFNFGHAARLRLKFPSTKAQSNILFGDGHVRS